MRSLLRWFAIPKIVDQLTPSTLKAPAATTRNDFGVGFDFTPSYGAVAASFINGSVIPLAKIDGDNAWRELMIKVALEFDFPPCDPCVKTLASMMASLAAEGERILGQPITSASASMPAHLATSHTAQPPVDNLIRSAFSATGIEYLQIIGGSSSGEPVIFPENSVLAGHRLGLCEPYNSSSDCLGDDDHLALPVETYYYVGYYANALEVTTSSRVLIAYDIVPASYVDHRLGAEQRHHGSDDGYYWEAVRRLLTVALIERRAWPPRKVILYGDHSHDERLREVVKDVLDKVVSEPPEWVEDGVDPAFVGAFGAAEFAKREPFWDERYLPIAAVKFEL